MYRKEEGNTVWTEYPATDLIELRLETCSKCGEGVTVGHRNEWDVYCKLCWVIIEGNLIPSYLKDENTPSHEQLLYEGACFLLIAVAPFVFLSIFTKLAPHGGPGLGIGIAGGIFLAFGGMGLASLLGWGVWYITFRKLVRNMRVARRMKRYFDDIKQPFERLYPQSLKATGYTDEDPPIIPDAKRRTVTSYVEKEVPINIRDVSNYTYEMWKKHA